VRLDEVLQPAAAYPQPLCNLIHCVERGGHGFNGELAAKRGPNALHSELHHFPTAHAPSRIDLRVEVRDVQHSVTIANLRACRVPEKRHFNLLFLSVLTAVLFLSHAVYATATGTICTENNIPQLSHKNGACRFTSAKTLAGAFDRS
jgi:hypothetical protein